MTLRNAAATATLSLGLLAGISGIVDAQDGLDAAGASTAPARPAVERFNPFNTWAASRFGVTFFGMPRLAGRFADLTATPSFAGSAAGDDEPIVVSTSSGSEAILSGTGRPDYRPPVRSPFRPDPE